MRYIRVALDTELLAEQLAFDSGTEQTVQLVVDTEATPLPAVVARVLAAYADAVVDALNA